MERRELGYRLYQSIKNKRTEAHLRKLTREWINKFNEDSRVGMVLLLKVFSYCSGCTPPSTAHPERQGTDNDVDVKTLEQEYKVDKNNFYPLKSKVFKETLSTFVDILVQECDKSNILFHVKFLQKLINCLTNLSLSNLRAFRDAGTFSILKFATALTRVGQAVENEIEITLTEIEYLDLLENTKETNDEKEIKRSRIDEFEGQINNNKEVLAHVLDQVFVRRVRDYIPDIRTMCLHEIGIWMSNHPKFFLHDRYLTCIGNSLGDEEIEVQLKCVEVLRQLYGTFAVELVDFTKRYKNWIVDLLLLKHDELSVGVIKLLTSILTWSKINDCDHTLTNVDGEKIYNLVFHLNQPLARAAAEFLFKKDFDSELTKASSEMILDLVCFLEESNFHGRVDILVDSMEPFSPFLKDWQAMTTLLLEDGAIPDDNSNRKRTLLLNMMISSIRQTATGHYPNINPANNSKERPSDETTKHQNEREELTLHFMDTLPDLLKKYFSDLENIPKLLLIPKYLDLQMYSDDSINGEIKLHTLLVMMYNIFDEHVEIGLLTVCSEAMADLCKRSMNVPQVYEMCKEMEDNLVDALINGFRNVSRAYLKEIEREGSFIESSNILVYSVKKLAVFEDSHDLSDRNLWHDLFKFINLVTQGKSVPLQVVSYSLNYCFMEIIYRYHNLDKRNPNKDNFAVLKDYLSKLQLSCKDLLKDKFTRFKLAQDEAFLVFHDQLKIFRKDIALENHSLTGLVCTVDEKAQQLISMFIQKRVFDQIVHDEDDVSKCKDILTAFCSLILYNLVPIRMAVQVLRNYQRFNENYQDIMRHMASRLFEVNGENFGKIVAITLTEEFCNIQQEPGQIDQQTIEFSKLGELAENLTNCIKYKTGENEPLVALHCEGIRFAIYDTKENRAYNNFSRNQSSGNEDCPTSLQFLCILHNLLDGLSAADLNTILQCLENNITHVPHYSSSHHQWLSYVEYKKKLIDKRAPLI